MAYSRMAGFYIADQRWLRDQRRIAGDELKRTEELAFQRKTKYARILSDC